VAEFRTSGLKMSSVEPVRRGPAVKPVTLIRRNALLTRDTDESRNETVITVAMIFGAPALRNLEYPVSRGAC